MTRIFQVCFIASSLLFIAKFCEKKTDTFTIWAVSSKRGYNPKYETKALSLDEQNELKKALKQRYSYFGRGGQAYAFFSEDGKYVIKFFKQRLFKPSKVLNTLPLPKILHRYREKRNWKRKDKLERDFFSYKVAFDDLKPQTGIIYSHLNPTNHLKTELEIIDRLKIHHHIDLDQFDFVVQKRAERVYDRIDSLMRKKDIKGAEKAIHSVLELISLRAKKGYRDRDPNIRTNCGFIGEKAVKIDVGRFVICPEMQTKTGHNNELKTICAPFKDWIEKYYPELEPIFEKQMNEALL